MVLFYLIFFLLMIGYAVLIAYYHRAWNDIPYFGRIATGSTVLSGKTDRVQDSFLTDPSLPPVPASTTLVVPATIALAVPATTTLSVPATTVSVVIALRNESQNILRLIESLEGQDYPKELTEIILVDDHSTDNTWQLMQGKSESNYLKAFQLSASTAIQSGAFKKHAISLGIAKSRGELIVTTDADCSFEPGWLSTIVSFYLASGNIFIAAPVRYSVPVSGTENVLSIFEKLDFITLQGITGASVYRRFHTMCNGANLAYKKDVFLQVAGFEDIDHIPSGDDMLLMYKIHKKYPRQVSYLKASEAIVTTAGTGSWAAFLNQRIRWSSKAIHYDDKRIFWILLMVYLLNVSFLIAAIASFFKTNYFIFFLLMLSAKVLIEFPFVNSVAMFFGQQRLMRYFPFMQPLHILYTIVAGWLGRFGSYQWKGRKIVNHGNRT